MSIKPLKSRGSPPWGCTMAGYVCSTTGTITSKSILNLMVRFFTPNTTTEVAKTIVPVTAVINHVASDATNVVSSAIATDQATLDTLLNEIKADYNAHIASTTFHSAADSANAVTSADSSSEATAVTLANEIKADFNAHRVLLTSHLYVDSRDIITKPDATNLATAITLSTELKTDYNAHRTISVRTFTIYGIAPGTYDIGTKSDNSISKLTQDVVFTPGPPVTVNCGFLPIGNVNGDEDIDSGDQGVVNTAAAAAYGSGDCNGYPGTWQVNEQTVFGDWTVIPTARRKTY